MANRIKGITVEIGGDTTGLEKALKSVNTTIKSTQSALKDVNKLLKLDPSNTELLSQKQKLLKDAIDANTEVVPLEKMEEEHVRKVVDKCHGNISRAAELLEISRQRLYKKLGK